jgi:hypothetical protein
VFIVKPLTEDLLESGRVQWFGEASRAGYLVAARQDLEAGVRPGSIQRQLVDVAFLVGAQDSVRLWGEAAASGKH